MKDSFYANSWGGGSVAEWLLALSKREGALPELQRSFWLPPRDSNPDMLIQSQLSYH